MLANTLSITIGTDPAITLTRNREDGGASVYVNKNASRVITLNIRQSIRLNKASGTSASVYNASLIYEEADTPTVLGKTYTASFTGSFEEFGDPAFSSDLSKALHTLGATIMVSLAGGEV